MTATSDERALATWLSRLDDERLAETLRARGVSPRTGWRDFFDAAEGLLEAGSVDRALTRLSRGELRAIADPPVPAEVRPALTTSALIHENGRVFAAVAGRIAARRADDPGAFAAVAAAPTPVPADGAQEAAAAERALTTTGALADVLLALGRAPLARTGAGTVTAVDRRRLVESGGVSSGDDLDDLLAAAERAGLVVASEREWSLSSRASGWLAESTPARWSVVVAALQRDLPDTVRTSGLADAGWDALYPLDPDWPRLAERWRRLSHSWGLVAPDASEPAWTARVRAGAAVDAGLLARHLPTEIDRVYLQADLTAIAPGPLAPGLDVRLRSMTHRESRAQASTYRFDEDSLRRAIGEGETADSIRAFLGDISLTGIPQPLAYLIDSVASRHGAVRVTTDAAAGRTRIDTSHTALRDTIAVDQSLRILGLVADGGGLISRATQDVVYWLWWTHAIPPWRSTTPEHRRCRAGGAASRHRRDRSRSMRLSSPRSARASTRARTPRGSVASSSRRYGPGRPSWWASVSPTGPSASSLSRRPGSAAAACAGSITPPTSSGRCRCPASSRSVPPDPRDRLGGRLERYG